MAATKGRPAGPLIVAAIAGGVLCLGALVWLRGAGSGSLAQPSGAQGPPGFAGPAPDFTVETLDHGPFTLSQRRGEPLLLFFSATY